MTFKEFLKSQEDRLKAETAILNRRKRQQFDAFSELMTQIKSWAVESDPEHLLVIHDGASTYYDNKVDQEPLPRIDIEMGDRIVSVLPIARNDFIGPRSKPADGQWSGRVDMIGHPYSFQLWLSLDEQGKATWYIRNDRDYALQLWSKEAFDKAMVELLS